MGYYVKPIVCDYGVYNDYNNELCLVCNRKANAELIVKILQVDNGDDAEHHHDKVCRDYEPDCRRKTLERVMERLEEYRDDFMDDVYEELRDDSDNLRANRIIERFDEATEIVKEELEMI